MQIKSIKASRIGDRVNIAFTNNSYLPLLIGDVLKLSLVRGLQLTDDQYQQIINRSTHYLLYSYALRRLAAHSQIAASLLPKLQLYFRKITVKYHLKNITSSTAIESVLDRLNRQNLLNQSDFINYIIRKYSHKSRRFIAYQLQHFSLIPADYNHLLPDSELSKIKKLIDKKITNPTQLADITVKNKLILSLTRRGFSYADVKSVIDAIVNNS